MNISQHEDRIVIDCSVSDYGRLIAAARDLDDNPQAPHVSRPIKQLLSAHAEYTAEIGAGHDSNLGGVRTNAEEVRMIEDELRRPVRRPPSAYGRGPTAELIGAPVSDIAGELTGALDLRV